jgi:hypothetical protein
MASTHPTDGAHRLTEFKMNKTGRERFISTPVPHCQLNKQAHIKAVTTTKTDNRDNVAS